MQLPVEQFPILNAGQMNPFHQALQSGMESYQNNMKTAYMPYALQADIASKQAYANNYARQMAAQVLSNPAAVSRMTDDQINSLLGGMSDRAQNPMVGLPGQGNGSSGGLVDWLKSLGGSNQTISPQTGEQPAVTMGGGSQPIPQVEVGQVTPTGNMENPNPNDVATDMRNRANLQLTGDVTTGSGKGVGAGTTFRKPGTTDVYSSPTQSTAGSVQTSLMTSERVSPYVNNLADTYEKSFGLKNNVKAVVQGVGSYLTGGSVKTPELSAMSQYQTNLVNAADGFLKELNLNNTTGNRESMERALQNGPGESPEDYRNRINWLWGTIKQRDEVGKRILAQGIMLNPAAVQSEQGRQQLSNSSAVADSISGNKKDIDPSGSWPRNKNPVNANALEGQMPPEGTIWMVRPDGMQVAVHKSNKDYAKKQYKYRDVN